MNLSDTLGSGSTRGGGSKPPPLRTQLVGTLDQLSLAHLKPFQRLELLKVYALPRMIYVADHDKVGQAVLSQCDRDIRTRVKMWLLLYASPKDGGLGVIKLAKHIPTIQLRHLKLLYNSTDKCTKTGTRAAMPPSALQKLWSSLQDGPGRRQIARQIDEADIDLRRSPPRCGETPSSKGGANWALRAWVYQSSDKTR